VSFTGGGLIPAEGRVFGPGAGSPGQEGFGQDGRKRVQGLMEAPGRGLKSDLSHSEAVQ